MNAVRLDLYFYKFPNGENQAEAKEVLRLYLASIAHDREFHISPAQTDGLVPKSLPFGAIYAISLTSLLRLGLVTRSASMPRLRP